MVRKTIDTFFKKEENTVREFFDFYSLSILNFFAGEKSFNHTCRTEKIKNIYEETVENFYSKVRSSLCYAVVREFRHFNNYFYNFEFKNENPSLVDFCKLIKRDNNYESIKSLNPRLEGRQVSVPLEKISLSFKARGWEPYYGGRKWKKAADLLMENPKNISSKEIWVDKVLDLFHNTGHILNKTDFYILSSRNVVLNEKTGKRRNALNYRRYCDSVLGLSERGSRKVKKLVRANLNFIPYQAR